MLTYLSSILYYTILYYTILYYTILYYTILYYTILYYTILYYTAFGFHFSDLNEKKAVQHLIHFIDLTNEVICEQNLFYLWKFMTRPLRPFHSYLELTLSYLMFSISP